MSETALMYSLTFLLILLIPLLLSYIYFPEEEVIEQKESPSAKEETRPSIDRNKPLSFEQIARIFTNSHSEKEDLREAIEQLIRHHGKIKPKLGDLPHPDFKRYLTLIIALSKHPKADKDLIISLYHKLSVKNPRYNLDIDEATNKGIAARGF